MIALRAVIDTTGPDRIRASLLRSFGEHRSARVDASTRIVLLPMLGAVVVTERLGTLTIDVVGGRSAEAPALVHGIEQLVRAAAGPDTAVTWSSLPAIPVPLR